MSLGRMSRRLQRGQSLVEALVATVALLPLLFAVPLIAKYQDIRHAAVSASRTAAFECSVRPEVCVEPQTRAVLADGLRRRHFARHDRDLLSNDSPVDSAAPSERNRFWVGRSGDPLLAGFSDVSLELEEGTSDAARGAYPDTGGAALADAASGVAGPVAFGLRSAGGLITSRVRAHVSLHRTLADWLSRPEGLRLALTGKTAVLVDAWNASAGKDPDPRSFQSRVELGWRLPGIGDGATMLDAASQAAPAGLLGGARGTDVEESIDLLYSPIRLLITGPLLAPVEPRGRLFRYHEIDVDVVPADRIRRHEDIGG